MSYHIVQKELDRISTVFRKYIWDNLNLKCRLLVYTKFNWKGHFKEIGNHPPNEKKLTSNEGLVGLPIRRHNMDRNDKAFLYLFHVTPGTILCTEDTVVNKPIQKNNEKNSGFKYEP